MKSEDVRVPCDGADAMLTDLLCRDRKGPSRTKINRPILQAVNAERKLRRKMGKIG